MANQSSNQPPSLRTSIGIGPAPGTSTQQPINAVIPQQRRGYAVTWQYVHTINNAQVGLGVQMPAFRVPSGSAVRVRAVSAGAVFVATDYGLVVSASKGGSGGTVLHNGDDIEFAVSNTAEIWVLGSFGDGVILSVNRQRGHIEGSGPAQQDRSSGHFT